MDCNYDFNCEISFVLAMLPLSPFLSTPITPLQSLSAAYFIYNNLFYIQQSIKQKKDSHGLKPNTDFSQDNVSKLMPKSFAYLYDLFISSSVGDRAISL
jgi:hypothetical protein